MKLADYHHVPSTTAYVRTVPRDTGFCILFRAAGVECVQHFADSYHTSVSIDDHSAFYVQCSNKYHPVSVIILALESS